MTGVQSFPAGPDAALFREGVELLLAWKRTYPGAFAWRRCGDAVGAAAAAAKDGDGGDDDGDDVGAYFVDVLTGSGAARRAVDAAAAEGDDDDPGALDALFASWDDETAAFYEARREFLLY
jgi:hypothetical protein